MLHPLPSCSQGPAGICDSAPGCQYLELSIPPSPPLPEDVELNAFWMRRCCRRQRSRTSATRQTPLQSCPLPMARRLQALPTGAHLATQVPGIRMIGGRQRHSRSAIELQLAVSPEAWWQRQCQAWFCCRARLARQAAGLSLHRTNLVPRSLELPIVLGCNLMQVPEGAARGGAESGGAL